MLIFQNQQIEIEMLRRTNAILHIRLAEALSPHLISPCEKCFEQVKKDVAFKQNLKEKLENAEETIKVSLMRTKGKIIGGI